MPDSTSSTAPFEHALRVEPSHLDDQQHVNNVVYLQWVQDVAIAHWRALASPAALAEIAWVALRHEIDYLSPAVLGDELLVKTWVGPADGVVFERHTEVSRARDRRLLARARSRWCPVSASTGRPRRVPPDVRAQFSAPDPVDPSASTA